ncbi:hypothetical protein SAMN06295879_1720 [Agreia bicolorata]|uniref:Uncharacterized protein n=1 Tax=Agreia bicolorata TaxID=110935 RepID=A0A1T4XVB7_9MICO|nr:hypothetical protein [Agreia bicolorata]SKA93512.1 hypothetical protein SAMN06295879_1720 [Agreia bicolorata]
MSTPPGTPWQHAGPWRGAEPHGAVRTWLLASGLGGLMLAALLLAPPVSTPAPLIDDSSVVVTVQ